jgi:hypothetical protein
MSSWTLILFQMLPPKFGRMWFPTLLLSPLLLLLLLLFLSLSPVVMMQPPNFTKELELTVHRGDDPVQDAPLLEVREVVPEGQAPSPSLAAFNKSFGTSHRGELLSVGFEAASIGSGASKILTLWKSPTLVDDTGEGSEQTGGVARESGKGPHSALRRTSASQGKTSSSSRKKVTMQNLSKHGSFLFVNFCIFQICEFLLKTFSH